MPLVLEVGERRVRCHRTSIPLQEAAAITGLDISALRKALGRGDLRDVSLNGWLRLDPEELAAFIERGIGDGTIAARSRGRFAESVGVPVKR